MRVFNLKRVVSAASKMYWISHLRFSSDPYFLRRRVWIIEAPQGRMVQCRRKVAISEISEYELFTKCQDMAWEGHRMEAR